VPRYGEQTYGAQVMPGMELNAGEICHGTRGVARVKEAEALPGRRRRRPVDPPHQWPSQRAVLAWCRFDPDPGPPGRRE
jgi:hypothetical protein